MWNSQKSADGLVWALHILQKSWGAIQLAHSNLNHSDWSQARVHSLHQHRWNPCHRCALTPARNPRFSVAIKKLPSSKKICLLHNRATKEDDRTILQRGDGIFPWLPLFNFKISETDYCYVAVKSRVIPVCCWPCPSIRLPWSFSVEVDPALLDFHSLQFGSSPATIVGARVIREIIHGR